MCGHVLLCGHLSDMDEASWLEYLTICKFDKPPTDPCTWDLTCLSACLSFALWSRPVRSETDEAGFQNSTANTNTFFWNTSQHGAPVCQRGWKGRRTRQPQSKINCIWPVSNVGSNLLLSFSLFSFIFPSLSLHSSPFLILFRTVPKMVLLNRPYNPL